MGGVWIPGVYLDEIDVVVPKVVATHDGLRGNKLEPLIKIEKEGHIKTSIIEAR